MTKNVKSQRGLALVPAILIVVVVLVIGAGAYYFGSKNSTPPETTSQSKPSGGLPTPQNQNVSPEPQDETSNWKTYSNETWGFEIKYPDNWESTRGSYDEGHAGFFYVAFGKKGKVDKEPLVTIRVYPDQTTLDKFLKYFDYLVGNWENVTLSENPAKRITAKGQDKKSFTLIASVKNGYGYEIASTVFGDLQENELIVNKMIQAIKLSK